MAVYTLPNFNPADPFWWESTDWVEVGLNQFQVERTWSVPYVSGTRYTGTTPERETEYPIETNADFPSCGSGYVDTTNVFTPGFPLLNGVLATVSNSVQLRNRSDTDPDVMSFYERNINQRQIDVDYAGLDLPFNMETQVHLAVGVDEIEFTNSRLEIGYSKNVSGSQSTSDSYAAMLVDDAVVFEFDDPLTSGTVEVPMKIIPEDTFVQTLMAPACSTVTAVYSPGSPSIQAAFPSSNGWVITYEWLVTAVITRRLNVLSAITIDNAVDAIVSASTKALPAGPLLPPPRTHAARRYRDTHR